MTSSRIAFSKELNYTRYRAIRRDVKSERFRMLLALKTLKQKYFFLNQNACCILVQKKVFLFATKWFAGSLIKKIISLHWK